ncbi:Vegetative incompatibility HET-E-1, partial [Fusarium albosuccineum]
MDGLSVAANVIAVVELTAKVASLCVQYSTAVKNARSDIERLQRELNSLEAVLSRARSLAEGPHGAKLQAIQQLQGGLDDASSQLLHLCARMEEKLANSKTRKAMSRFGIRALKWPFESSEIETIIRNLDRNRDALSTALIIDNTALQVDTNSKIKHISQTLDISRLPLAKDAAFDSHMDEHDARCLPNTRVELRQEITTWAISPDSDTVFWLNGMAGTGKSTISRTIAQTFADKGCLGASFFFNRGERDRGNASRLFTTIAAQLIAQLPDIGASVMEAIDEDPSLPNRTIREQFNKLILNPLRALDDETIQTKTFVLVLDALDECDRVDDVRLIINLLTLPKSLPSIKLRAFVTSRPELPILLGFNSIKGKYRDLVLHEIPKPVIEHDISEFLHHRLEEIRKEYNSLSDPNFQLDASWPGGEATDALLQMAIPLFIFAATICRFIQDPLFDPPNQLTKVLKYQTTKYDSEIEKLDTTYRPTLDQMLVGRKGRAKDRVLSDFRAIVGTIVLLAEPLSVLTLSLLLDIPESAITSILRSLHSVLHVPNSVSIPIRILHLSFRDFLVDPELRDTNPFWVDEKATHERIATNCLRLLTTGNHLKQDIYGLSWPGISRYKVDEQLIESKLPGEIRYACLYWPHHLEQGGIDITDNHEAHVFLRDRFLFWLEALSLLGRVGQSSSMINTLQSITSSSNGEDVSRFLHDAAKFQSTYKTIIDEYPLQLYASGITFAPQNSVVKAAFAKYRPEWILQSPQADQDWNTCLQAIDTSLTYLDAVLFLPDNRGLMIASANGSIQFWDPATGEEKDNLEGQKGDLLSISADAGCAVSANEGALTVWDPLTGEIKRKLEDFHAKSLDLSTNGKLLACALQDNTILILDPMEVKVYQRLYEHTLEVLRVVLSPNGQLVASALSNDSICLWDAESGVELRRFKALAATIWFSPDSTLL